MPPRKPADETDNREPVGEAEGISVKNYAELDEVMKSNGFPVPPLSMHSLVISGVILTYRIGLDGAISDVTWRTGHLEHIANLYAGDPAKTERDYADDLAVARAYSAETWDRLTNG